jgi:hypothetical protein
MVLRDSITPVDELDATEFSSQVQSDAAVLMMLKDRRVLNPRQNGPVPKQGNLQLAWEYAKNPKDHHHFTKMLRVSPFVFEVIYKLIHNHE